MFGSSQKGAQQCMPGSTRSQIAILGLTLFVLSVISLLINRIGDPRRIPVTVSTAVQHAGNEAGNDPLKAEIGSDGVGSDDDTLDDNDHGLHEESMSNISHEFDTINDGAPRIEPKQRVARARETEAELECVWGRSGKWIRHANRTLPQTLRPDVKNEPHKCGPNSDITEDKRPGLWYGWEPPRECSEMRSVTDCSNPDQDSCSLNPPAVCAALDGRQLFIIGDSTYYALHNSILLQMRPGKPIPPLENQMAVCPTYTLCDRTDKIKHASVRTVRNDHLVFTPDDLANANKKKNVYAFPFIQHIRNHSIIVMNRGAHYEPTGMVMRAVRTLLEYLREHVPGAIIIYHHTNPAVHLSLQGPLPVHSPPPVKIQEVAWGWQHFHKQNLAMKKFISLTFPEVTNIDISYMLGMRVDNRRDPIHSCVPGWVDWQAAVLAHAIIKLNPSAGW